MYWTIWHEMGINLTDYTIKSYQGFKRYGNPDMPFLGTLKNKIQILRFLTIDMKNLMSLY